MSTLTQQAALAVNPGFLARVRAAMVTAAAAVLAETLNKGLPQTSILRYSLATEVMQNADQWLSRFGWACATVAAVAQADMSLYGISATAAGPPAVVTTTAPFTFATGAIVTVAGAADQILNGTWPVTVTSPTTFTIPVAGTQAGAAGGTVTDQPTDAGITTAVASVWNDIAGVQPGMV